MTSHNRCSVYSSYLAMSDRPSHSSIVQSITPRLRIGSLLGISYTVTHVCSLLYARNGGDILVRSTDVVSGERMQVAQPQCGAACMCCGIHGTSSRHSAYRTTTIDYVHAWHPRRKSTALQPPVRSSYCSINLVTRTAQTQHEKAGPSCARVQVAGVSCTAKRSRWLWCHVPTPR